MTHSWSGNLVTQDSWDDIWLNEGFTSYVENRIVEAVYGSEFAVMETAIKQHATATKLDPLDPRQQAERASSARFARVDAARTRWLATGDLPARTTGWSTQEWLRFLDAMPDVLEADQLRALDRAFGFTGTANGEIARRWYSIVAASTYEPAYGELRVFLSRVGRMKLVLPVYRALAGTPDGAALAQEFYAAARSGYHPITAAAVEKVLAAG